jgi:7-cyano-7-deazaguanine synthase
MSSAMASFAVLISGGLDSAILLGSELASHQAVFPIYVRCGLCWETTELRFLGQFLRSVQCASLQPLTVLDEPVRDIYTDHWSITGEGIPDADSPDDAVFLPGRNVLLLIKALLWCHLNGVCSLALGSLGTNPFPDASGDFFRSVENIINQSVRGTVRIALPFAGMTKRDVMRRGEHLPLEHTFSCIHPSKGLHCGRCNKCAERRRAFTGAGMSDPTKYA